MELQQGRASHANVRMRRVTHLTAQHAEQLRRHNERVRARYFSTLSSAASPPRPVVDDVAHASAFAEETAGDEEEAHKYLALATQPDVSPIAPSTPCDTVRPPPPHLDDVVHAPELAAEPADDKEEALEYLALATQPGPSLSAPSTPRVAVSQTSTGRVAVRI